MKLRAEAVAALVALAALASFGILRGRFERGRTRVVDQRFESSSSSGWAGVTFQVAYANDVAECGPSLELLDEAGHRYPLFTSGEGIYTVPLGYAAPVVKPRVRVFKGTETLTTLPLQPFPAPSKTEFGPDSPPLFRATFRQGNPQWSLPDQIEVLPLAKPPQGNWEISDVRTPLCPGTPESGLPDTGYLPYASSIDRLSFTATLVGLSTRRSDVTITGLRLEQRGSKLVVVADQVTMIDNPLGNVVVPIQSTPAFPKVEPHHKPFTMVPKTKDLPLLDGPRARADLSVAKKPTNPNGVSMTAAPDIEIVSPLPEELGLRELTVGNTVRRTVKAVLPPVKFGPFVLKIRLVDRLVRKVLRRSSQVLTVGKGTPQPKPDPRISYFGSWSETWPRASDSDILTH